MDEAAFGHFRAEARRNMHTKPARTWTPAPSRTGNESGGFASLAMNFFPVELSEANVTLWAGRWTAADAERLIQRHAGLQVWRDRDDGSLLYAWYPPHEAGAQPEGLHEVTVTLQESPPLFQRLLTDAVHDRLLHLGFTEKGHGYVNYERPGLMHQVPALASVARDAGALIDIYPKVLFDVFFTRDASDRTVIGLVVDVLYTELFSKVVDRELRG